MEMRRCSCRSYEGSRNVRSYHCPEHGRVGLDEVDSGMLMMLTVTAVMVLSGLLFAGTGWAAGWLSVLWF